MAEKKRDEYLSRATGKVRKRRSDGWTQRDINGFLSHLRVTGNIGASAAAVGKSYTSAYNLRDVDPEFAAQMDAALDEAEGRLENKIALFAETGGKLPPLAEGAEPVEAPLGDLDPHLALAYLAYRRAKREKPGRGPVRRVSKAELAAAIMKLVEAVIGQRARRGQE